MDCLININLLFMVTKFLFLDFSLLLLLLLSLFHCSGKELRHDHTPLFAGVLYRRLFDLCFSSSVRFWSASSVDQEVVYGSESCFDVCDPARASRWIICKGVIL